MSYDCTPHSGPGNKVKPYLKPKTKAKPTVTYYFTPTRMATKKNKKITNVGKNGGETVALIDMVWLHPRPNPILNYSSNNPHKGKTLVSWQGPGGR